MLTKLQKSEEWLAEQRRTIGASRAAKVLDRSPYGGPADAYDEMTGAAPELDAATNPDLKRGLLLEDLARQLFSECVGVPITPHNQDIFQYHPARPWAHVLPDSWWGKDQVEQKVPRPTTWQRWYLYGLPEYHIVACQHAMAVTGGKVVHFVALCPVTMAVLHVPIERDSDLIANLMTGEEVFWLDLKAGRRPENGQQSPQIDIPPSEGAITLLGSDDAVRAARAYLEARQIYDEADQLKQDAAERLLQIAGDGDAFEVSGELRFYNRFQPGRQTFDHKAAVREDPELKRFHRRGDPFRSFRAYDMRRRQKGGE